MAQRRNAWAFDDWEPVDPIGAYAFLFPHRDQVRGRGRKRESDRADREFEDARRASLLDQRTKDNESRLDDTMASVHGNSDFTNAVTDLSDTCVICMDSLFKAETNQLWCGALRVPCSGCDGKGPFVHAKCAERMDGTCPVCRKDVKTLFRK